METRVIFSLTSDISSFTRYNTVFYKRSRGGEKSVVVQKDIIIAQMTGTGNILQVGDYTVRSAPL